MPERILVVDPRRSRGLGLSISYGLARPRSLVGGSPTQVTASHGPGIQPCRCSGNPAYQRDLMRRQERKRGAMVTGDADREGVEPR